MSKNAPGNIRTIENGSIQDLKSLLVKLNVSLCKCKHRLCRVEVNTQQTGHRTKYNLCRVCNKCILCHTCSLLPMPHLGLINHCFSTSHPHQPQRSVAPARTTPIFMSTARFTYIPSTYLSRQIRHKNMVRGTWLIFHHVMSPSTLLNLTHEEKDRFNSKDSIILFYAPYKILTNISQFKNHLRALGKLLDVSR